MNFNTTPIENVFHKILSMSFEASLVILFILVLRTLLKKRIPAGVQHALWFLVLARLTLPWFPQSPTSFFALVHQFERVDLPMDSPTEDFITNSGRQSNQAGISMIQIKAVSIGGEGELNDGNVTPLHTPIYPLVSRTDETPIPPANREQIVSWQQIFVWFWLLGVILVSGTILKKVSSIGRVYRTRTRPAPIESQILLKQCMNLIGLQRRVNLAVTQKIPSPALFGLFSPKILLPEGYKQRYSQDELRLVLMHELIHFKRNDHWVQAWTCCLLPIYWINPLVWVALRMLRADRELAVDEAVLKYAPRRSQETYGEVLLKTLEPLRTSLVHSGLLGIVDHRGNLKTRIERIASYSESRSRPGIIWKIGMVSLSLILLCNPVQSQTETDDALGEDKPQSTQEVIQAGSIEKTGTGQIPDKPNLGISYEDYRWGSESEPLRGPNLGSDNIRRILESIIVNEVGFNETPLADAVAWLYDNSIITGDETIKIGYGIENLPPDFPANINKPLSIYHSTVTIDPPRKNISIMELIDLIVEASKIPIKRTIRDYGVFFSVNTDDIASKENSENTNLEIPSQDPHSNFVPPGMSNIGPDNIRKKLESISLDEVGFVNTPLKHVTTWLGKNCNDLNQLQDLMGFIISGSQTDVRTGHQSGLDVQNSPITIDPPRKNLSAMEAIDLIVEASKIPIKSTLLGYGVNFSFDPDKDVPVTSLSFKLSERFFDHGKAILNASDSSNGINELDALRKLFEAAGLRFDAIKPPVIGGLVQHPIHWSLPDLHSWKLSQNIGIQRHYSANGRGIVLDTRSNTMLVRCFEYEKEIIQNIINVVEATPPQITVDLVIGEFTRELAYTDLGRPLGRVMGLRDTELPSRGQRSESTVVSKASALQMIDMVRKIQGFELLYESGITTISDRGFELMIPLNSDQKQDLALNVVSSVQEIMNQSDKFAILEPLLINGPIQPIRPVKPIVPDKEVFMTLSAHIPSLTTPGQVNWQKNTASSLKAMASKVIPKNHTFVYHHMTRLPIVSHPLEASNKYMQREIIVFATPTLIDPAGNQID